MSPSQFAMAEEKRVFTRANRGSRMHVLVEESLQAMEQGQSQEIKGGDTEIGEVQGEAITYNDYFNDSSDEGSYVESEESEDYVDSDFVTEDEEDDDEEDEEAEHDIKDQEKQERKKNKKGAYVDPAKRAVRMKPVEESESDSDEGAKSAGRIAGKEGRRSRDSAAGRTFRSTTTKRSEASKTAATEAQSKKQEGAKTRTVVEERRLTQDELLAEAVKTALDNEKDLQRLVRIEEDMKKVVWNKTPLTGARLIFHSSRFYMPIDTQPRNIDLYLHGETLTWRADKDAMSDGDGADALPPWMRHSAPAPPPKTKAVCVITGLPARYRDPLTGHPYATLEAFKKIRSSAA